MAIGGPGQQVLTHAINTAVATTTSDAIDVKNAKRITLYLQRSVHSAGSTDFTVTVSGDDVTYIGYNKLITNVANTNGQTLTRVATVSLSSNTTSMVSFSVEDCFQSIKITATRNTDGTADAWALVQYN
jgi:hypothetical protein